jgi:hypothetical protein
LNQASTKEFKKIKNQLENIDFENIKTDEPGNLTYFIKVKTSDYTNAVRWNDNSQNTELSNTFKMLVGILQ